LTINSATIQNDGAINIQSAGSSNASGIGLGSVYDVTLSGAGTLTLGNPDNSYSNYIFSVTSSGNQLINAAGHTIRGKGYIGDRASGSRNGYLALLNYGTIIAEQNGLLKLDSSYNYSGYGYGVTNNGTFQVASGATMQIVPAYTGTGSVTFTNYNSGTLALGRYDISGTFQIPLASTESITTIGSSTGNNTEVILSGTGRIVKNDGTTNALAGLTTNEAKGILTLQNNKEFATTAAFTNKGIVNVESGSSFTAISGTTLKNYSQSTAGALTNLNGGSLSASTIALSNGSFTKSGGTLRASTAFNQSGTSTSDFDTLILDNGTTNVKKYSLQGGTMTAGTVQLNTGGTYDQQNAGTASITDFNYAGGTITQAAGIPSGDVGKTKITKFNYSTGAAALPSTWDRLGITNFNQLAGNLNFTNLTLPAPASSGGYTKYSLQGGALNVTGTVDVNTGGTFNLQDGTLTALKVVNSGAFNYSGGIMNSGLENTGVASVATLSGSGNRTVSGAVTNTGTFDIQTAFTITSPNTYTQSGLTALTRLNGTMTADSVIINGGTFTGAGTVNGPLTVNGGNVQPGNSPGTMTVSSYTQNAGGTLEIQVLSASLYDQLVVTGAANLGGTLNVSLSPEYNNNITLADLGKVLTVLTYNSYTGSFAAINLPDPDGAGPLYFVANYTGGLSDPGGLTLQVVPIPSTVWLLAVGLVGLIGIRRRRSLNK
jgi:hypothetical protein